MNIEQMMKEALDGWFFSMSGEYPKVIARRVPKKYTPAQGKPTGVVDPSEPHPNCRKWTKEQDDTIFSLRNHGMLGWEKIADVVGGAAQVVRKRYYTICENRGVAPVKLDVNSRKFSEQQVAMVVRLRAMGMTFEEIGKEVGMTRIQCTDLHKHLRKHGKLGQYLEDVAA